MIDFFDNCVYQLLCEGFHVCVKVSGEWVVLGELKVSEFQTSSLMVIAT